jgi:hypothetical protein
MIGYVRHSYQSDLIQKVNGGIYILHADGGMLVELAFQNTHIASMIPHRDYRHQTMTNVRAVLARATVPRTQAAICRLYGKHVSMALCALRLPNQRS